MTLKVLIHKISRKLLKLVLKPIRVLAFHNVSDFYDCHLSIKEDWMSTDQFKKEILLLKKQYDFISIVEAYKHLKHDLFRKKKFCVLTFDDGFQSLKNVLPWLEEQKIPVTLFINAKYALGEGWGPQYEAYEKEIDPNVNMEELSKQLYLSMNEINKMQSPYITIGLHGYEHLDFSSLTIDIFKKNIDSCSTVLKNHPRYIPYMAYPWGRYNKSTQQVLKDMSIIPVFMNGDVNYKYKDGISRECLSSI